MKQIVLIHGGDSFLSYDDYLADLRSTVLDLDRLRPHTGWKDAVIDEFADSTDVLTPRMPNSANAQFEEWKIWFEKIIPFFGDDVRLVGHSLGAMFLAKYLHQSPLPKPVRQLHLVAGGYDSDTEGYGQFALTSATNVPQSATDVFLYHSEDDFVVPFEELAKFARDMPTAHVYRFSDRNHFLDATFPELIDNLKK